MQVAMKQGKDVLYDACNIKKNYREDYLKYINKYENYYKTIVRFNTDIDTCEEFHKKRGRNFEFDIYQYQYATPPTLDEGWDNIKDVSNTSNRHSFYIASPFFEEEQKKLAYEVAEYLRNRGNIVFLPCEHKIPNAWELPNYKWGKAVFEQDIKGIDGCEYLICISYGRMGSAGAAWELGYAYGKDMKTIVIQGPGTNLMSLMVSNGCGIVLRNFDEFCEYDFDKFETKVDKTMEQK